DPAPDGGWTSTLGWTGRPDGHRVELDACADARLRFDGVAGERIAFDTRETRFAVQGATLAGRLVLPPGDAPVPVVVLVHGSERSSARDDYALQRLFPSAGIGAFVYDKRGTGASGGHYTHDYLVLATDAIAATREARRLRAAAPVARGGPRRLRPRQARHRRLRRPLHPRLPGTGHRRQRRPPRSAPPRRRPRREHRLPGRQPGRLGRAAGRAHRTGGL